MIGEHVHLRECASRRIDDLFLLGDGDTPMTDPTTPTTEAGRALLPRCQWTAEGLRVWFDGAFREDYCTHHHRPLTECRDEAAEAAERERERIEAAVLAAMPTYGELMDMAYEDWMARIRSAIREEQSHAD